MDILETIKKIMGWCFEDGKYIKTYEGRKAVFIAIIGMFSNYIQYTCGNK